jgi:acyl-coenzyme A synthetase/AMP-(fatty) acid ligase/uncharacterized protein (DUF849 family)
LVPPPGTPGGLFEKVAGLEREVPTLERIVVLPIDGTVAFGGEVLQGDPNWQSAFGSADAGEADRVAALLPTGGTTGHPKIARLTNRNMVASSVASMLASGNTPGDRVMVGLPLFHVGGAFCGCLPALAAGASVYFPTAFGMRNPEVVTHFWRIIERSRITFTGIVPTSLGAVASVAVDGADLSSLRLVATGASTCPPEIERRFLATWGGDAVRQIYGMTEFAGAVTQVPFDKSPDGFAVGLPVALAQVAVLADGRIHREAGSIGELLVRGPQVFAGYIDSRQTAGAFHQGWLRSGDLCRIEPSGQVVVTGRIKDLIIRGGHNIDPAQIEGAAMQFPGVALAAAVGRPDAYAGEVPMLFVTLHRDATIDVAALADFMAEHVAEPAARPKTIMLVDDIPLTPVGKIFKPRLREIAAEHAVRQMLSEHAGCEGFAVQAVTDAERGLIVRVIAGDDAGAHASMRKLLEQLPLAIEITSTTTRQAAERTGSVAATRGFMSDKAVITCALNGVLTDPKQHHVPVTPEEMAREAKAAFDAGASVMHIHLRQQAPDKGHLPSWEVSVSREIQQAIRETCPGVIINHTTGTSGPNYAGALDCVRETRPEMAACNAGSLNYLKVKSDNSWAWPPMLFDNAVEKVQATLDVMREALTIPEFECFDVGIVRCVGMYRQTAMYAGPLEYNFVMGVASGMPADPDLLPILLKLKLPEANWQVTAIGRAEIWPLHQRCAELGGHLRTGLEDTFYRPDGSKVTSNGQLIETIAAYARRAGRDIASPAEARQIFGIRR